MHHCVSQSQTLLKIKWKHCIDTHTQWDIQVQWEYWATFLSSVIYQKCLINGRNVETQQRKTWVFIGVLRKGWKRFKNVATWLKTILISESQTHIIKMLKWDLHDDSVSLSLNENTANIYRVKRETHMSLLWPSIIQ